MKIKDIHKLIDHGDTVERILAETWLDADRGDWPIQNCGQRKSLVESAIEEYKRIREAKEITSRVLFGREY